MFRIHIWKLENTDIICIILFLILLFAEFLRATANLYLISYIPPLSTNIGLSLPYIQFHSFHIAVLFHCYVNVLFCSRW